MKNFEAYRKAFTQKALKNGFSDENIFRCLYYSENLSKKKLPIIYNSYHLAGVVGYKHSYLSRSIISTSFFYRHFKIRKKNGTYRTISEPLPSLKEIQYFILQEILYKIQVSKYCKSYIPKKKFKEYLRYHVNEKQLLTLDIEDFFSSITYNIIYDLFHKLGYAKDVSTYLANLCTYIKISNKSNTTSNSKRFLPQGAPTSPYLSNLILKEFDDEIAKYCKEEKIKYTRYADDMAFSGNVINKKEIESLVQKKLEKLGLNLKKEKTRLMLKNEPQILSGVILNEKMQLPKKERNEIRQIMYFIKIFTLENHLERIKEKRDNYLLHLIGRVSYALSLNPDDKEFLDYKKYLNELEKKYYS